MKRSVYGALIITASIISTPSYAFLNFGKSNEDITGTLNGMMSQVKSTTQLTSDLSNKLNVKPSQAASGAGALLALAQNQLNSQNTQELQKLIPGMSQLTNLSPGGSSTLSSNIRSLGQVSQVFTKLGLDPAMISQFAPIVLTYLKEHNASSGLLQSLSGLWKA